MMNHLQIKTFLTMMTFRKFIHCIFVRSWWVIAFVIFFTIIYEQGLKKRDHLYQQLTEQSIALLSEKEQALRHKQNLQLQMNSQSDLAWIELTLMKELGLVPEGQQKIYFYQENP
jgi:hypothetical protein